MRCALYRDSLADGQNEILMQITRVGFIPVEFISKKKNAVNKRSLYKVPQAVPLGILS